MKMLILTLMFFIQPVMASADMIITAPGTDIITINKHQLKMFTPDCLDLLKERKFVSISLSYKGNLLAETGIPYRELFHNTKNDFEKTCFQELLKTINAQEVLET